MNVTPIPPEEKQLFSFLPLREELIKNLASLNYESMTPIQAQSLPHMLKQEDVIAQAKTGSGKTAAFGISLLNNLHREQFAVQALILCPTRELAEQTSQVLRQLSRLLSNVKIINLSGGMPMKPQLDSLKYGAHIIVGTPGRILKHLDSTSLSLAKLRTVVLDEADKMLDMGFLADIKKILAQSPNARQTLLFSATYTEEIKALSQQFMQKPHFVQVAAATDDQDIQQQFYELPSSHHKFALLKSILFHFLPSSALIFCNTKQNVAELTATLLDAGFYAAALHGDMEQVQRDLAILRFVNQSSSILVATDVAARGLDIKELPLVINFDLAFEADIHLHRIGRTGRAGHTGLAITLTTPADAQRLCALETKFNHSICWADVNELKSLTTKISLPPMVTLSLMAGKKDKIRPGDILGALTKDAGLSAEMIGKINLTASQAYVALQRNQADKAYKYFQSGQLKGRKIKVKYL